MFFRMKPTHRKVGERKLVIYSNALLICLSAAFQMSFGEVAAEYGNTTTIEEILRNPVRDQVVTVIGQIVGHVKDNDYLLDDGTGQIVIDGGPAWHHQIELPLWEQVTATGEVDLGPPWLSKPLPPEIDLYSVVLQDGTEINLRGEGPPPWAGGRGRGKP